MSLSYSLFIQVICIHFCALCGHVAVILTFCGGGRFLGSWDDYSSILDAFRSLLEEDAVSQNSSSFNVGIVLKMISSCAYSLVDIWGWSDALDRFPWVFQNLLIDNGILSDKYVFIKAKILTPYLIFPLVTNSFKNL